MEEISNTINKYPNTTSDNLSLTNDSLLTIDPFTTNPSTSTLHDNNNNKQTITNNNNNNKGSSYRKELIIAKVIISELQDKVHKKESQINELEIQLNQALDTIKTLHKDYCSLTDKFSQVNQSVSNYHSKDKDDEVYKHNNNVKALSNEQEEIYKINISKLNEKIMELQAQLINMEEQLEKTNESSATSNELKEIVDQLTKENISQKNELINLKKTTQNDIKKYQLEIENLKGSVSLLETKNHSISVELKEKTIELQKQLKLNEQYNVLDQQFTFSIQEKDKNYNLLNEQYTNLFNEYKLIKNQSDKDKFELNSKIMTLSQDKTNLLIKVKDLKQKLQNQFNDNNSNKKCNDDSYYLLEQQKMYIEELLLKTHPNASLIKQIIDLNTEVIQLEMQKGKVEMQVKGKRNAKEIIYKINTQIELFKTQLKKLEIELTANIEPHFNTTELMSDFSQE